ncbi:hypothetical protein [Brevibacillus sp. AG162]|uniref:hypothetical protein n=1 Tax=Brevibacillus sp. AG162 TaxID=2572910 RepID=UPI00163B4638|nr:hypothetical protein [Brevibacillus sp. AG162]
MGRQRLQDPVFSGKKLDEPDLLECIGNPVLLSNKVTGHIVQEQIGFDRIRLNRIEFDRIGFGHMDKVACCDWHSSRYLSVHLCSSSIRGIRL